MSNLTEYKSELVQSIDCELDMLERGDKKCADLLLKYRHEAMLRVFIIDCVKQQENYDKKMVGYLYETVKELTRLIITNKCIQSKC